MTTRKLDTIQQAAGLLAPLLGEGWKHDTGFDSPCIARVTGPDHEVLIIAFSTASGRTWGEGLDRVLVRGVFPAPATDASTPPSPSITVGRDRGPVALAREVKRRLLPAYRAELLRVWAWNSGVLADMEACESVASDLAEMVPTSKVQHGNSVLLNQPNLWPYPVGKVAVHSGGLSCDFTLNDVPTQLVRRLLAVLADA